MSTHIDPQVIKYDGKPAFAVIPWEEYQRLVKKDSQAVWLPHEVVKASVVEGSSLIRAWREHLGLTQAELAAKAGMAQSAVARAEHLGARPRMSTIKKLAAALGISAEQLRE